MKWFIPILLGLVTVYMVSYEGPGDRVVYTPSATFVIHTDSLGVQSTYELK